MFRTHGLHISADPECPGKSVNRWMRNFVSLPGSSRAKRWHRCVGSSASPGRLATRSSTATGTAEGLSDRSRAPYRQANRLPYQVERAILGIKKEHDTWGARKIRDKLIKQFPMVPTPAISTIHAVLDRHGLDKRKKRRRYKEGTPLVTRTSSGAPLYAHYCPESLAKPSFERASRGSAPTTACRSRVGPFRSLHRDQSPPIWFV